MNMLNNIVAEMAESKKDKIFFAMTQFVIEVRENDNKMSKKHVSFHYHK